MKKFTTLPVYCKKSFIAFLAVLFCLILRPETGFGQTPLITANDGGFETGTTFAANGWTSVNATNNFWYVGTAAVGAGTRAAYTDRSGTAGAANNYQPGTAATNHFYRDIFIPAGGTNITLSFLLRGSGEIGYDRLLVYTAPTTVTPISGTPASNTTGLTGATLVYTQISFISTFTIQTVTLPVALGGTTVRLIFTWQNDNNTGTAPSAAVDNISLTYTPASTITTGTINPLTYCAGLSTASVSVPFTSVGTFTSYTVQLSNTSGSFATPLNIGTGTTSPISATIPAGTVGGTGYRIRVISTSPAVTGTDNGSDITINNPAAPTGSTPQIFCAINSPTVANLTATGTGIKWYAAATGGTALASTTALVGGTHYYASQTVSGCEGFARLDVTATLSNPSAPTGAATQSFCVINNPTVANLTATGTGIQWYAAATGGTALASTTALVSGTHYYASQTVSGCEGTARLDVIAAVGNPAAPSGTSPQSFCSINNPTIADLGVTGSNIKWYAAPTGGTALATTTALVNGTHYYASQTVTGCESATRLDVLATVGNPSAPTGASTQSFCTINSPTVGDLNATGTGIKWYSVSTGGTALATTVALVNGNTYYASQTVTGCESATRLAVNVTISNPPAPTGSTAQLFCSDANPTVANLTATGTTIQWYSAATGGTPLAPATALVNGTHYYASQTVGLCESATRLNVTATVYLAPSIATDPGPATQTACASSNVTYTVSASGSGLTYQWLRNGNPISNGGRISGATTSTFKITGVTLADAGDYSVVVSGTSPCNSATSAIAHLDVDQKIIFTSQPATPQTICQGQPYTITASATGTIAIYQWFYNGTYYADATFDGANTYTLTIPAVATADAGSYRLFLDDGTGVGCTSANSNIAALNVSVTSVGGTVSADATVCYGTSSGSLTLNGQTGNIVRWESSTDNFVSVITPIGNTGTTQAYANLTQTTQYRAVVQSGVCPAVNSVAATITVNPNLVGGTVGANQTICNNTTPVAFTNVASPTGGTGSYTYQWQSASAVAGPYNNIPGATTLTYASGALTSTTYYRRQETSGFCGTVSSNIITITVNPTPAVTTANTASICSGTGTAISLTASVPSTFTWVIGTITGGITGASAGSGSSINQTLTNPGNTASGTVQYIVTPTSNPGSCPGSPYTITVTVNPTPVVTTANIASVCSGAGPNIALIASTASTFTWTIGTITGSITGASAGSGNIINQILTNPGNTTAGTVQYIVTPTATTGSCPGSPYIITVTVNPTPVVATANTASICSGTGPNISLTASSPSSFTWTIGTITGGITGASAGSGNTINQILTNPGNTTAGTVQYKVTPTTSTGSCPGAIYTITVTVNPTPVVTTANTASTCSGAGPNISLTASTPSTFTWTIGTITGGITGASAGSGSTINQSLTNPGNTTAGTVQYLVTPTATTGSCAGSPYTITVTVNPIPVVTTANTASTCSGTGPNIALTASAPSTFTWTIGTITGSITGASSGSGNTINQTLTNPSNSTSGTVQYLVTPTSTTGSCPGLPYTITVTVNPAPTVTTANTASICSGTGPNISLTASVPSSFIWTIGTITGGITGASAGSGTTINQTLTDPSNSASGTVQYKVTPTATTGLCPGAVYTITITVNPTPVVTNANSTICNNTNTAITLTSSTPSTFTWILGAITGGVTGATAGSGSSINQVLSNPGTVSAGTVKYIVTPTSVTGSCPGSPYTITVTVNPTPTATITGTTTVCQDGTAPTVTITNPQAIPVTVTYKINGGGNLTVNISASSTASGTVPTGTPGTTTYTLVSVAYQTAPACSNPVSGSATVIVRPTPTATISGTITVCQNAPSPLVSFTNPQNIDETITYNINGGTNLTINVAANSSVTIPAPTSATGVFKYNLVSVIYQSAPSCSSTLTGKATITVLAIPTGSLTETDNSGIANNDKIICAGDPVTFTATSGYGSYTFYRVGQADTLQRGTSNILNTSTLVDGDQISVFVANSNNCGVTFGPITITVKAIPATTLIVTENSGTANDKIICPNAAVTLTAPANATSTFSFIINGSTVSTGSSNNYTTTAITSNSTVAIMETNSNGCSFTTPTQNITVTAIPTGTITVSPGNSFCAGTSVTFTATAGAGNTYNFKVDGITKQNTTANTYITSALTNGQVVSVVVTNSGGCPVTFNSIPITVYSLPAGTLTAAENSGTPNDNNICAGTTVTFTATGATSYNFKVNGVSQQNGASNSYVNSTLADNDMVTVVATNGTSCVATYGPIKITVLPSPAGTLSVSPASICAGDNVTFTATGGFDNYNFRVNGTAVQNGASNTYSSTTFANGDVVTVDVTNTNTCTTTFNSITLTINPIPTGTLAISENSGTASNDGIICTGASVIFTAPIGFTNYNFFLNGISIQNGSSKTYTNSSLANGDKVTVAVTNGGGCIGLLNEYTITVNPLPTVAAITGANSVCMSSTITLSDATTPGVWSSENPGIATVDATTGVVTGVAAGTATIDYTYTNSNSCSNTVSKIITVNAPPVVTPITGNFNVCTGNTSQLSDATNTGGTWVWSSSNGSVATVDANTGLVSGVSPGSATISYTFTDGNGCSTTVTADINVADLPIIAPITTTSPSSFNVCVGGNIPLKDATSGGVWSSSNPSVASISATGVVFGLLGGTTDISYTITTTCGQTVSAIQTVVVTIPPSAGISYAGTPFCTTSGPGAVTQTGTTGGTYSSTTGLTIDGSSGTITPSSSTPGNYTVTYKIAASGGCGAYMTTTPVTINAAPTITSFTYSGSPYCSTVTSASPGLTASSTTGTYTYTVSSGGPTLSIVASTGVINPSASSAGTYAVTYTIAASGGCSSVSKTTSVTISANPTITTFTYSGSPYCSTLTTASPTLTASATGTYSYTVTTGGPTLTINSSTGVINPSTSSAGTYTVTYSIAASAGCAVVSKTTPVTITPAPAAIAGTAVKTCSNNPPVNITAGSSATNYSTIAWTSSGTGTFTNANSLTAATYTPSAADITAGSVTLTLTANGTGSCGQSVSTKILTISPPPPAFVLTPSGTVSACQGSIQPLTATANASSASSVTVSSAPNLNLTIPDATSILGIFVIPGSVTTNLTVATVPAGAVVNSVSVNFNITHTYDGDLVLNLKAPNGKVLNLVDQRGNSGDNFTNTTVSSLGVNPFLNGAGNAPFTGTFRADADNGVGTPGSGNTVFSDLFSTPNGTWTFGAEDDAPTDQGKIVNWSITINYTVPATPLPATWSPATDLYTDAGATAAYTGITLSTVYAKPATAGTKVYTATITNAAGCSTSQNVTLNVGAAPTVTIAADYCAVPNKVKLTATATPAATSYLWNTGETTQTILVDVSGIYSVLAYTGSSTCPGKGTINVANELVTNGNFEAGNVGFTSAYPYRTGAGSLNNPPGYAVDTAANYYGPSFLWGKDHTTTHGKFMMVNGAAGANYQIWQETISVLPNTTYYFSAWGLELDNLPNNPNPPFGPPANATLQFNVNGAQTGTLGNLPRPNNPTRDEDNNQWVRFYGSWTSGPATTSAVVSITDLQGAVYGNNFGLDDISFGTLSTFVELVSATGTDAQTICVNNPLTDIVYSAGSSATSPTVTGLPPGVTTSWNGVFLTITGTPTLAGNYSYTVKTTGSCQPATASGTITVQAQKIALSAGSSTPTVCLNSPITNIVYTLSGTATGATVSGLPAGVTYTASATTVTISGAPTSAAGSPYSYTVTTTGSSCTPVMATGTITVQSQTITLNAGDNTNQTVCINSPVANIRYNIGGTATGATIMGLPPGVTGTYNSGIFTIAGSPSSAAGSPYNYTITTTPSTGSCTPVTATGTIAVTPGATIIITSAPSTNPQTVCKGTAIAPLTYAVSNGTGASVTAGALPAGVTGNYAGGVFTISGTTTAAAGTYNFTITASGGCPVAGGTATGTIIVQAQIITLTTGIASPSVCTNAPMASIVYTLSGTATGATVTGLPAGVMGTLSANKFIISGTPTVASGSFPYSITTSGTCAPVNATGTITILPAPIGGTLPSAVSTCSGGSGILTLSGSSGTVQRWEYSTDGGTTWTPIANTTTMLSYTNITIATLYRVVVTNGCGSAFSSVATVGVQNLWVGGTSSDWNTASNWSDGQVPTTTPCPTVTIPVVTSPNVYPVLSSGIATIVNLNINTNASLTITNGKLQVAGTITNNGILNATAGTIEMNGTSTQTIAAGTFMNNDLKNLIVSNTSAQGVILAGPLNLYGMLSFGNNNNQSLVSSGKLNLRSTSAGTAMVRDITNNNTSTGNKIGGDVVVERYYAGRRAWRLVTAPVSTTRTLYNEWQIGGMPATLAPASGTYITSPTGGNGLDVSQHYSLKTYNDTTGLLVNVMNTISTPISRNAQVFNKPDNIGYFMFVRGDRKPSLLNPYPITNYDITTLRDTGVLQTGQKTFTSVNAGFMLIGNPYASPVDFGKLGRINVPRKFWAWDPRLNLTLGAYVLLDGLAGPGYSYIIVPAPDPMANQTGQDSIIQSSQAIFVQPTAAGATVVFNEDNKATKDNNTVFRPAAPADDPVYESLRSNLYLMDPDTAILADGVYHQFNNDFSFDVDQYDALKFTNFLENFGISVKGQTLTLERRPLIRNTDTIFFKLWNTTARNYQFRFSSNGLNHPGLEGYLVDSYLKNETKIELNGYTNIDFNVTNDAASKVVNRFMIVFRTVAGGPLPVTFTSVKAYQNSKNINVDWNVANEIGIKSYEVEKSKDGLNFSKSTAVNAKGSNNSINNLAYQWVDSGVIAGTYYYRIRTISNTGEIKYSNVVKVIISAALPRLYVYPNPIIVGTDLTIHFENQPKGRFGIRLMNKLGQVIMRKQVEHDQSDAIERLPFSKTLAHGAYQIEITKPDGSITNIAVIY